MRSLPVSLVPHPHVDRIELLWEAALTLFQHNLLSNLFEHRQELVPSACHTAVHLVMDPLPLRHILLEDYHTATHQSCCTAAQEGHQVPCSR